MIQFVRNGGEIVFGASLTALRKHPQLPLGRAFGRAEIR